MRLDLSSLPLSPAGAHLGVRPDTWFRAPIDIDGVQHFLELVSIGPSRPQRCPARRFEGPRRHGPASPPRLRAYGPFATVTYAERPFVLFVTPSCQQGRAS